MVMNYVGFIVGLLLSAIGIYVHAKMQQAYFDHRGDDRRPDDAAEAEQKGWLTPAQLRLVQRARAAGSLSTPEVYEAGLTERGIIDALLSEVIARRRDAADNVRKYHPRGEPCPPQSTP